MRWRWGMDLKKPSSGRASGSMAQLPNGQERCNARSTSKPSSGLRLKVSDASSLLGNSRSSSRKVVIRHTHEATQLPHRRCISDGVSVVYHRRNMWHQLTLTSHGSGAVRRAHNASLLPLTLSCRATLNPTHCILCLIQ